MGKAMMIDKFAGPMMPGGGFEGGYMVHGGGFGIEGLLFTVLHLVFWLIVILVIVKLVKHLFPQSPWKSSTKDEAYEILRQRYAKGEIDTEEFNDRKKVLGL